MYQLLDFPERPLPLNPTHCLIVDVLNKDTSQKRVSIYFNPEDAWEDPAKSFEQNTPKAVGNFIGNNLKFINSDLYAYAYRYWVIEISTQAVVHKSYVHALTEPHDLYSK